MPKFRVRLESPDMMRASGEPEFRVTMLRADDEHDARTYCERREREIAASERDADEVAKLEEIEAKALKKGELPPGDVRGKLHTHRQTVPYDVVSVLEVV